MTYIKKLKMHGFKSFQKPTEILFDPNLNTIVGPNGAGKCLTGDSIVQLGDGSLERIEKIINSRLHNAVKTEDGFLVPGDDTEIMCLDINTLKTIKKPIKAYVKRKSPDTLLEIKTRSGKTVKTTKYHPFFSFKEDRIIALKADELKKGVRIAIPRKIDFQEATKFFVELIDAIKFEDNVYVPYRKDYSNILKSIKGNLAWKQLSLKLNVPSYTINGLLNGQSINFAHLIRIMKFSSLSDQQIMELIPEIISNGKKCKMIWKNSEEFSRFFGYLLAEGRLAESSQIWFTNSNKKIVDDYAWLVEKLFNKKVKVREYKANCYDVIIFCEPLKKILNKLGMASKTENKKISNILLKHSSNKEITSLLNGLYCGDGYVSSRSIEITTKSEMLVRSIEQCLLRIGIVPILKKVIKRTKSLDFSGEYYTLAIYGVNNFKQFKKNINLIHNKKRKRIDSYLNKKINPNIDLIEATDLIKRVVKEQKLNVKKLRKKYSISDAYFYNQCLPSRNGPQILATKLFSYNCVNEKNEDIKLLNRLVNSDIFWDEIVDIREIEKKEEYVYDLCVEEHHNFIANNVFVHNSNISDAICFVLGRLSKKSMRADITTDFIYNGGKNFKPSSEAIVEMVLDNSEKTFSIPTNEISIARIVRRNGNNIYKMNGETKTRQEILDVLAQGEIDPYGFNIVLQGEIARFIQMHAEERRGIIEEVAGIRIFELRKEKALSELEKTEEKLKEIKTILNERSAYLKNLEKERDQALKYENLKKKVSNYKATLLHKNINDKNSELEKINKDIEEKEAEISDIKEDIDEIKGKIDSLNKEIDSINKEIEKATGIGQETLHKEIAQSKADVAALSVRHETLNEQLSSIEKREQEMKKSISVYEHELEMLKEGKKQAKKEEKKLDISEFKQQLNESANRFKELSLELLNINENLKNKLKSYEFLVEQVVKDGRIDRIKEVMSEIRGFLHSNSLAGDKLSEKISELADQFEKLSKIKIGIEIERDADLEISLKEADLRRTQVLLKRIPQEKQELKSEIKKIKEELKTKQEFSQEREKVEKKMYDGFQKLFSKRADIQNKAKIQQEEIMKLQIEMRELELEHNSLTIARAKIEAEHETLEKEFEEYKAQGIEIRQDIGRAELEKRIQRNEQELSTIGSVNMRALEVYNDVKSEYDKIAEKTQTLETEKVEILKIIDEIDKKKRRTFMKTFEALNSKFSENFSKVSTKGIATLELERPEEPFSGGVDVLVKLAKGKYIDAHQLSGGEQTLIALSLIFAIQDYKPYHFYVLDEIDAALDKRNSESLATLLKGNIKNAQYIIITHNDAVISEATTLYGVTMQDSISKILSLKV